MHIQKLIECYVNEKSTNTFLKYNEEVIEYFYNKIVLQKSFLKNLSVETSILIKSLCELEIDRIEYLVKEYILIRINKMKFNQDILEELLSQNEKVFYNKIKRELIFNNKKNDQIDVVGFICKNDLGNVLLDEENIEMNKDDFYVGPLSDIYFLLTKDDIFLV